MEDMAVSPGFPGGKRQEGLLPEALEGAQPCRYLTSDLWSVRSMLLMFEAPQFVVFCMAAPRNQYRH